MLVLIFILSIIGLVISLYTYLLELKVKKDSTYRPFCNLNNVISCTKPIISSYSNIFYFSNAIIAITYYCAVAILSYFNLINLIFYITILSCLISLILAYLLFFKIKSLCLLCVSLYIINFLILFFAYKIRS